jgi:hypothetical protein
MIPEPAGGVILEWLRTPEACRSEEKTRESNPAGLYFGAAGGGEGPPSPHFAARCSAGFRKLDRLADESWVCGEYA